MKTQMSPSSTGACVTKDPEDPLKKTCVDTIKANCNLILNDFYPDKTCVQLGILPPIDADGCDSTLVGSSPKWQFQAGPLPSGRCRYCRRNNPPGGYEGPHIHSDCIKDGKICPLPQPLSDGVSIEPNNRIITIDCIANNNPTPSTPSPTSIFCETGTTPCQVGIIRYCCPNGVTYCDTSTSSPICLPNLIA